MLRIIINCLFLIPFPSRPENMLECYELWSSPDNTVIVRLSKVWPALGIGYKFRWFNHKSQIFQLLSYERITMHNSQNWNTSRNHQFEITTVMNFTIRWWISQISISIAYKHFSSFHNIFFRLSLRISIKFTYFDLNKPKWLVSITWVGYLHLISFKWKRQRHRQQNMKLFYQYHRLALFGFSLNLMHLKSIKMNPNTLGHPRIIEFITLIIINYYYLDSH